MCAVIRSSFNRAFFAFLGLTKTDASQSISSRSPPAVSATPRLVPLAKVGSPAFARSNHERASARHSRGIDGRARDSILRKQACFNRPLQTD